MTDLLASAAVLVLASGSGTRLGEVTPKQLHVLAGKTLVQRAVETYREAGLIVVAHHPDHEAAIRAAVEAALPERAVVMVPGGATRLASIRNALAALDARQWSDDALVVLHNAASPNTPTELVRRCLAAARISGAAQAYVPCDHTMVRLVDDSVESVLSSERLGHTADPTVYRLGLLRQVLAESSHASGEMTLDLMRQQNVVVTAIQSPPDNIKVTVPLDLVVLDQCLSGRI